MYCEKISAQAGDEITVPVSIRNNSGIMGYKIILEFDDSVFTPVNVTRGNVLTNGLFENSLSDKTTNKLYIIWTDVENRTDNGVLFSVTFNTSSAATGEKKIKISYSKDDTFDENWKDVELKCSDVTVDFGNVDEPTPPAEPTLFQRIMDFFAKVWNFIKGLFK